jgi:hypothetical protein
MRFFATVVLCLPLTSTVLAEETFDFNDGTNGGLTEARLLEQFGIGATFSFPGGNTYRISGPGNPLTPPPLDLVGPNRAAAMMEPTFYSDFSGSVDLVDWDDSLSMNVDLLARIEESGDDTRHVHTGYAFGYGVDSNELFLSRVDDDVPTPISPNGENVPVILDPLRDYRMVFTGDGPNFVGQVFDLDNLNVSLATITGTDASYTQGRLGLFATGARDFSSAFDATFDNLILGGQVVPEPSTASLVALSVLGLLGFRRRGLQG